MLCGNGDKRDGNPTLAIGARSVDDRVVETPFTPNGDVLRGVARPVRQGAHECPSVAAAAGPSFLRRLRQS